MSHKILFLTGGAREGVLESLLLAGSNVVAVVCPRPSKVNSRFIPSIVLAHQYGIPVITVKKTDIFDKLEGLDFDILLSCGFSYILNKNVIQLAKRLAVNIHPTLLPKYRGFRSGPFIIMNGETKSGVTIHELTEDMDKGDIFIQEEFEVTPFDTTRSVFAKAKELEKKMVLKFFENLASEKLVRTPQDESEATVFDLIRTPEDSEVNPSIPLKDLYNVIRSCDPVNYPAFIFVDGEKVCIKLWRPNNTDLDLI